MIKRGSKVRLIRGTGEIDRFLLSGCSAEEGRVYVVNTNRREHFQGDFVGLEGSNNCYVKFLEEVLLENKIGGKLL